jgi:hypothetical protein
MADPHTISPADARSIAKDARVYTPEDTAVQTPNSDTP